MEGYKDVFSTVLEDTQSPSPQAAKTIKNWQGKSPEEQVIACRELLYEGVAPILRESLDHDQVAAAIALFETTFKTTEQLSMSKGSSRAGSSQS